MYRLPNFTTPQGLIYAISEASEGNQAFLYGNYDDVKASRIEFLAKAKIPPENTVVMMIEHGNVIHEVKTEEKGIAIFDQKHVIHCDAMITNQKNTALFLLVADCIPIVLFDDAQSCLAIVHHGINNTKIDLVGDVVAKLREKYNVAAHNLTAILGPALQKKSYRYEHFEQATESMWQPFVEKQQDSSLLIDNVSLTINQLQEAGIQQQNIHNSGIDTFSDKRFFSHKRDLTNGKKDQGRFAMVAMLTES